jgi:hypothetical protein
MKKVFLTLLVVVIGLTPALALAAGGAGSPGGPGARADAGAG